MKRIVQKAFKSIEDYCHNNNIPILFSVECESSNSSGQMENYTLVLTKYKILLFTKRNFGTQLDIHLELPIISIQSIFLAAPSQYCIILKTGKAVVIQTNADLDQLVVKVLEIIEEINFDSNNPIEIQIGGFPKDYSLKILEYRPTNHINMRYEAVCAVYNQPINPTLAQHFSDFDKTHRTFFTFYQNDGPIFHPNILSFPLLTVQSLSFIQFKGVCPNIICKSLSTLMKHSKVLSTVIFEDYPDLLVNQLEFAKLKAPTVVSWSFRNCFSKKHRRIIELLKLFSEYYGDIQTFQFDNVYFDLLIADELMNQLKSSPCFQTLEILDLVRLDITELDAQSVYDAFTQQLSNTESIFHFHFDSKYSSAIQINESLCNLGPTLQSIVLNEMNLVSFPVMNLPENITNIEFPNCKFSPNSLVNVFKCIHNSKNNISLNLSDLKIGKKEWTDFENLFGQLPQLENLVELDWSGNPVPASFQNNFIRVLLNTQKIRYLGISRVFKTDELSRLFEIIEHLSNSKLWGLDIEGDEKNQAYQYGEVIVVLVLQLSRISSLEHLNISNHFITADTFDLLSQSMKNDLKMIHELLIDGTKISKATQLFECYTKLIETVRPRELGRPRKDIKRLTKDISKQLQTDSFNEFKHAMNSTKELSTRLMRSSFYHFSADLYHGFAEYTNHYSSTTNLNLTDDWLNLTPYDNIRPISLHDTKFNLNCRPFRTYQASLIKSPYEDTPIPMNLGAFEMPENLMKYKQFKPSINYLYYVDDHLLLQPKQMLDIYQRLVTPELLKTLENIDTIMKVFENNCEIDKLDFEKDFKKPPLYVSKAAIDFMKAQCLNHQSNSS